MLDRLLGRRSPDLGVAFLHPDLTKFHWEEWRGGVSRVEFCTLPLIGSYATRYEVKHFLLGAFRVIVEFQTASLQPSLAIISLDHQHGHPEYDSRPGCLGTLVEPLKALYAKGDKKGLVDYLLAFLRRLTRVPNYPGRWPPIDERDSRFVAGALLTQHPEVRARLSRWVGFEPLSEYRLVFVGLGTIGSRIACAAARLGFRNLWLVDDDKVQAANSVSQAYSPLDKGKYKVEVLARQLQVFACAGKVRVFPLRWGAGFKADRLYRDQQPTVILTGLDSMSGRRKIWKDLRRQQRKGTWLCLIDGRLHGSLGTVLTVDVRDQSSVDYYQAHGLPWVQEDGTNMCGMNAYAPAAAMVEAIMLEQLLAFCDGQPTNYECRFDMRMLRHHSSPTLMVEGARGEVNEE